MKIAVYTVFYGNREPLNPECMRMAEGFDSFVVTDRGDLNTNAEIITEPAYGLDPKRACSRAKLNPYLYFSDYDWVIYLDNKANLLKKPDEIVSEVQQLGDASFYVFSHGGRNCVYEEARTCIKRGLDNPKIIRRQMEVYRTDGYPERGGLLQGTFMVRRMDDERWAKAGRLWFEQVLRYSRRDQLSFNYIAWSLGLKPHYLSGHIGANDYVKWPVSLKAEEFVENYGFIPLPLRRQIKRALNKVGVLGRVRGRQHR